MNDSNYKENIKGYRSDSRWEMLLAIAPLIVGYWSFQWAVLLGIFWLTMVVIEFARSMRVFGAHMITEARHED
jgi:hypothetical protein